MDLLVTAASSILGNSPESKMDPALVKKRKMERGTLSDADDNNKTGGNITVSNNTSDKRPKLEINDENDFFNLLNHSKLHLRNRFIREYFYSSLDKEYFRNNEFVTCLEALKFGNIQKLKRSDWSKIRSIMGEEIGRPRRLSNAFLIKEREKLHSYRCRLRQLHCQLRQSNQAISIVEDIGQLSVGDHVHVVDMKDKSINTGILLSTGNPNDVDRVCYLVQFNNRELGRKWVFDLDIARQNHPDNVSESTQSQATASAISATVPGSTSGVSGGAGTASGGVQSVSLMTNKSIAHTRGTMSDNESIRSASQMDTFEECMDAVQSQWGRLLTRAEAMISVEMTNFKESMASSSEFHKALELSKACLAAVLLLQEGHLWEEFGSTILLATIAAKVTENVKITSQTPTNSTSIKEDTESVGSGYSNSRSNHISNKTVFDEVLMHLQSPAAQILGKYFQEII